MAKTIWKYKIPIQSEFTLDVPSHSKVLYFQIQDNIPHVWILVDPDSPKESKGFHLYGTGHPLDYFGRYIGSCLQFDGQLVWHLFED
jgi:hypothetical protein